MSATCVQGVGWGATSGCDLPDTLPVFGIYMSSLGKSEETGIGGILGEVSGNHCISYCHFVKY